MRAVWASSLLALCLWTASPASCVESAGRRPVDARASERARVRVDCARVSGGEAGLPALAAAAFCWSALSLAASKSDIVCVQERGRGGAARQARPAGEEGQQRQLHLLGEDN